MSKGRKKDYYEYVGIIHCHTHYSDGSGSIGEILQAAEKSNLDYIIVTDHDTLLPLETLGEGWHGNTLLLFGQEITPPKNHYLAFNLREPVQHHGRCPQSYIRAVRERGGIGFIAHPHDKGNCFFQVPPCPWEDFSVVGYDGIEIWNYFSDLSNEMSSLVRSLLGCFFPCLLLKGPAPETLSWWDAMNQRGHVVAIGGLDAHGIRLSLMGMSVVLFPYHKLFRTLRTHILTRHPLEGNLGDRDTVLHSLKRGHCYIGLNLMGNPKGFSFVAETREGNGMMGDEVRLCKGTRLKIRAPAEAQVRLIHNGKPYRVQRCRQMEVPAKEQGTYRVEVFKVKGSRLYPWIFSNPIFIN